MPGLPPGSESVVICATCAVERDPPLPAVCPVCADERQWVPETGQAWVTLAQLAAGGQALAWRELEDGLVGVTAAPDVGIGQTIKIPLVPDGQLVWDPVGYVDAATARHIRARGPVLAVAASHPHMFGVQVEWGRALDAPVLVNARDREWIGRHDARVALWDEVHPLADGLTLHRVGGHFAGSAVAEWSAGARGRGVLLAGDTVFPNPDRSSVSFLRSFPNRLPLSAAVVERIAGALGARRFDRVYGNFDNVIAADGAAVVRASAARHAAWTRGEHDAQT